MTGRCSTYTELAALMAVANFRKHHHARTRVSEAAMQLILDALFLAL